MKPQDKYREQAIQLLDRLTEFKNVLSREEVLDMIGMELVIASLAGKLEFFKKKI